MTLWTAHIARIARTGRRRLMRKVAPLPVSDRARSESLPKRFRFEELDHVGATVYIPWNECRHADVKNLTHWTKKWGIKVRTRMTRDGLHRMVWRVK